MPTQLNPSDLTIAVTVFSRRDYILEAVRSALNQTVPVKVIVVEDCGPDVTLRDFVLKEFSPWMSINLASRLNCSAI